jgi:23S rRNA (cytidine1920-2'-O)/16S rRNA (cytidine1409-2'-O)-methyltransferase
MKKLRFDTLIVEKGLIESPNKAQSLIMAGCVYVKAQRIDKCGTLINEHTDIDIKEPLKYVSRGGLKLEKARDYFHIDFKNKVVLDIGSSTGGFTDVALQSGAKRIHAVDVGKNLLHFSLNKCEKIMKHEEINFRYIDFKVINEYVDIIVCDVSFISIKKLLNKMLQFCKNDTKLIFLIKPQFEAEKKDVGDKGIVKDIKIHKLVLYDIIVTSYNCGFIFSGLTVSPIKGQKGNIEYLSYFYYVNDVQNSLNHEIIKKTIDGVIYESSFNNSKAPCRKY